MSHLSSNILSASFYGSVFSELLRIASCTLRLSDLIPRASELFSRMIAQGRNRTTLTKELRKAFYRCPDIFQNFGKPNEGINKKIIEAHVLAEKFKTIITKLNISKFTFIKLTS